MLTKRIIPCLDVNRGRVVKGINFVSLRDAGDPVEAGEAYSRAGADELVFLDITATSDARATVADMVRRVAERVFIPFTVGGGIRTTDDMRAILRDRIIQLYEDCAAKGSTPFYAVENVTTMYHAYHDLGGNGAITEIYHKFVNLPQTTKQNEESE